MEFKKGGGIANYYSTIRGGSYIYKKKKRLGNTEISNEQRIKVLRILNIFR